MKTFSGRTAVITGAGSGFGLETSRIAAQRGMNVVMADVQAGRARARRRRDRGARRRGAAVPARRRQGGRGRGARRGDAASASARRTSSSTTPASAPAG